MEQSYQCPSCQGDDTEPTGSLGAPDSETREQPMKCNLCGATWVAIFTFSRNDDVVRGKAA